MPTVKKPKAKQKGAKVVAGPPPSTPRPRSVRVGKLATIGDVALEAARLYRGARQGRVPPSDAAKFGFLLNVVRAALETATLEQRIERLEELERKADGQEAHRPHFSA